MPRSTGRDAMNASPSTIAALRPTAERILAACPQAPAVAPLDAPLHALDHATLLALGAATLELLADAYNEEVDRALVIGLRVGWALARAAEHASDDVDTWANAALSTDYT
jgi:hypothetical protein